RPTPVEKSSESLFGPRHRESMQIQFGFDGDLTIADFAHNALLNSGFGETTSFVDGRMDSSAWTGRPDIAGSVPSCFGEIVRRQRLDVAYRFGKGVVVVVWCAFVRIPSFQRAVITPTLIEIKRQHPRANKRIRIAGRSIDMARNI